MSPHDLENRFTHHEPFGTQLDRYGAIRARAHDLAKLVDEFCPDSREKSTAISKLEEVVFWANAAIARNEKPL